MTVLCGCPLVTRGVSASKAPCFCTPSSWLQLIERSHTYVTLHRFNTFVHPFAGF